VRRTAAVTVALVLLAAASGCRSEDGRELPPPDQTTTTTTTTTATTATTAVPADPGADDAGFRLVLPAMETGDEMPERFTCHGDGVSPAIGWVAAPPAAELALVVRELDSGALHWLVTGIDPTVEGFGEGGIPEGALGGPGESGGTGWLPPCPEDVTQHYEFFLRSLPEPLVLEPGLDPDEAAAAVEGLDGVGAVLTVAASPP
jgi:phosphatidylethanolamine-binding protein (PEBP) family uncharacterized protein